MCIRLTLDAKRSIVSGKGENTLEALEVVTQEKHYSIGKEGVYGQVV